MQSFLTSFSVVKNRRDNSIGHIFQGRYKSILVEHESYGAELTRYIHLNLVRTAHLCTEDVETRRKILRNYAFSSYRAHIGLSKKPIWLKQLESKGETQNEKTQQRWYATFVEEGLLRDIEDPLQLIVAQSILGSEPFIDKVRCLYITVSPDTHIRREQSNTQRLHRYVLLEQLIEHVAKIYAVDEAIVFRKHSKNNEAPQVLQYLACLYFRGRSSLTELALQLGPVSVGCLTRTRYNVWQRMKKDKGLRKRIGDIEKSLGVSKQA